MSKIVNDILDGALFGEGVRTAAKSNRANRAGLIKTGVGTTLGDCNRALVEAHYYREGAVASVDATIRTSRHLFKESAGKGTTGLVYRESIKDMWNTLVSAVVKIFDAIVVIIQKGSSWFVSEAGLLREYKTLMLKQDQLAKVYQEKGLEGVKKLTIALKAKSDKSMYPIGDILGYAAELANPDLFVSFDIKDKVFVGDGEGVPTTAEGLKALVSGQGEVLTQESKYRTVAALASYIMKFKEATNGKVDASDKEWLKNAGDLAKEYAKKGISNGDVFAAFAKSKGIIGNGDLKTGEGRGAFGKWMTQLTKIELDPATPAVFGGIIDSLTGKGKETAMEEFLAKYKANVKNKKTTVFFEMAKQAKEWRAAFKTANKEANVEKGSDEQANATVILTVLKSYIAAMNDVSKTFTDLVKDCRDGAIIAVKTYNDAISKILAAYGVKGKAVAKSEKVKQPAGPKTSMKDKAANLKNTVANKFKRKPKADTETAK